MSTIKYLIKSKSSISQIYVRIRDTRNVDISTRIGLVIDAENWSSKKGQIKQTSTFPEKRNFQAKLDQLEKSINDQIQNAKLNGFELDKEWLINCIDRFHGRVKEDSTELIKLIEGHVQLLKTRLKKINPSSIKPFGTTILHIKLYQKSKKKVFYISDVNNVFIENLITFLKDVERYDSSTVSKDISRIKQVLRSAKLRGLEVNDSIFIGKYTLEKSKRHVITLCEEELKKLSEFKGSSYLENARDWLIIGCRTGCRVSDLTELNTENIITKTDRPKIRYKSIKTKLEVDTPYHPDVKNIIEKLNGFPRKISDQKFNKYIKELCKIVGISGEVEAKKRNPETGRGEIGIFPKHEVICSHVCRRSFCTNHYHKLSNKAIMKVSGHRTESQFLEYIGEIDSDENISQFDNLYKSTNQ